MVGRHWQIVLALFAPMSALAGAQTPGDTLRIEEVEFVSHGVKLSGSLVLPRDGQIHAAVVFIHGSGKQTRNMTWARRFASEGIAALVYDKRGVGKSGGEYEGDQSVSEKNISLLADDSVSALGALASHPSLKGVSLGLTGISQAGWIAPLAANRSRGRDTDSREDLDRLSMPGLWIFSDNDSSIPVDLSIARLQTLRKSGHRYDYVLFSGLGHNNMDRTFAVATDWITRLSK